MKLRIAAAIGAVWGLVCYSILWGYVPIEVHRPFVESAIGTLLLLPARAVLWGIHRAESAAGRSFDLSSDSAWIGLAITLAGAGIALLASIVVRAVVRVFRGRGSGGESVPEPAQRV